MRKRDNNDADETAFDILDIDENRLDEEWLKQPRAYFMIARRLADYRQALEEAKAELDITKAELASRIREEPAEYNVTKVTEKAVEEAIVLQQEMRMAVRMVNKAKHRVDVYSAAVTAMDHRKKALENMVMLHGQNYFSTPRASGEDAREWERAASRKAARAKRRRDDS